MLGWHYRSRRESLISFSNAAFYDRSLLTIPDSTIHRNEITNIEPVVDVFKEIRIDKILDRSISFHYIENALYDNRKNKDEANYIANIVSSLLKSDSKKSIGIVAFSMQQQSEIEAALDRLAVHDPIFETLLEEEYQREDEDSFNGLFVKNLENVQGDERDIIIMSVCYGYNKKGRLLMNFGPINRRGGEKRLNVIFSRAKQNMVVVSSILPNEIKNDYNVGANYFKKFLAYSKHISDGKLSDANLILDGLYKYNDENIKVQNPIVQQLKKALEENEHKVDLNIGQSHFKCDLAIRNDYKNKYVLGILIDKNSHYANENVLEQYCQKPEILNGFGWKTITVYSKDWFEKPERVLERIEQILKGKEVKQIVEVDSLLYKNTARIETPKDVISEIKEKKEKVFTDEINFERKKEGNINIERFEFSEGNSNKFWEIGIDENLLIISYGRIGKTPRSITKSFDNNEDALIELKKMIAKKISKGYIKK